MRIAIFSDVHGNLTALEAVLQEIDGQEGLDEIVFAGDLCFAGPRPEACLEAIRRRDDEISCVYGNTDRWIDGPPLLSDDIEEEERRRRQQIHGIASWTRELLPASSRAWLRELPFQRRISPTVNPGDDLLIVHANPQDVDRVIFPPEERQKELYGPVRQTDDDLYPLLEGLAVGVVAFGHLHVPFVRRWNHLTLVNVSSVSMPGDGDSRAKYALLHWDDGWQMAHRYVPYDVEAEIEAFRRQKPPNWQESVQALEAEGMIPQRV